LQYESQINTYNLQIQENKATIQALEELLKKVDEKIVSSETIFTNSVVVQLKAKLVDYRVELAGLTRIY
jgi:hypothetical protein